jgi:hypothetical protein
MSPFTDLPYIIYRTGNLFGPVLSLGFSQLPLYFVRRELHRPIVLDLSHIAARDEGTGHCPCINTPGAESKVARRT